MLAGDNDLLRLLHLLDHHLVILSGGLSGLHSVDAGVRSLDVLFMVALEKLPPLVPMEILCRKRLRSPLSSFGQCIYRFSNVDLRRKSEQYDQY